MEPQYQRADYHQRINCTPMNMRNSGSRQRYTFRLRPLNKEEMQAIVTTGDQQENSDDGINSGTVSK